MKNPLGYRPPNHHLEDHVTRWWTRPLPAALMVAAAALLVRGLHLLLFARGPFFAEPVVDSLTYHQLAVDLSGGGPLTDRLLWQAPFYPLVLSGLYAVAGPSVTAARILGAVVGTVTCLAAWRLGRRVLGPGGGLVAGLITALHGVLVAFDTELLATGWATLWFTLGAWLLVRLHDQPTRRDGLLLGAVLALALVTRTVLAVPLAVGAVWVLRRRLVMLAPVAAATVVLLAPYAVVMHHHTGHAGLWPPSGAINLHLGNSADLDRTLAIRPGLPWEELVATPVRRTGVNDPWHSARWFRQRTAQFVGEQPGRAVANLGAKTLHLLSSRELPRNVDLDVLRPWSPVMQTLAFKLGPLGLPTGLLIPLVGMAVVLARRRVPAVVWLLLGIYALELVLVFTSARYRAPMWPLATVVAVAGWQAWPEAARRPRLIAATVAAALLLIGTLPGPHAQERLDLTAEMWHGVGYNQLHRSELTAAEQSFRTALDARADYPEAWNRLGVALARRGRYAESIPCFERALELAPGYGDPGPNLRLARQYLAQQARPNN